MTHHRWTRIERTCRNSDKINEKGYIEARSKIGSFVDAYIAHVMMEKKHDI